MKNLLLILLFSPMIVFGQYNEINHSPYWTWGYGLPEVVGTYRYLISDNVNIRKHPSTKSTIIATLPIASRLKILKSTIDRETGESTEEYRIRRKKVPKFTYNNIIYDWYKVSFINNNIEDSGYVVGAFIADNHYITSSSPSIIFLSSILRYDLKKKIIEDQLRVVKNNKEIDRINFLRIYDGNISSLIVSDSGQFYNSRRPTKPLDLYENNKVNDLNIIEIAYSRDAGLIFTNGITFFFDNEKLHHIKTFVQGEYKRLAYNNGKIQFIEAFDVNDTSHVCTHYDYMCDPFEGCCFKEEIMEEYIWDGRMLQRID